MRVLEVEHRFFPVSQGLFATGFLKVNGGRLHTYRWVYDCGSNSSTRLVDNAIEALEIDCSGAKIDLLTLSHFHEDHINGVVKLLNSIGARTLMLPWAPLWQRLAIAFDQGFDVSDPEMLFFVDPFKYFTGVAPDSFDQILFVMPSEGGGPAFPSEPPDEPTDPDVAGRPGRPDLFYDLGMSSDDDSYVHKVRILDPGKGLQANSFWEFVPYNDPATRPDDPLSFESNVEQLKRDLLGAEAGKRQDALGALKRTFKRKFGKVGMNNVSLFLYGGAIGKWLGWQWCECRICQLMDTCHHFHEAETRASILFSGDGNLKSSEKWRNLSTYLRQERATRASVFQVPHHGSRNNSFTGLAAAVAPDISVISSDPVHSYGHPHAEVLRDFWSSRPIQVSQSTGFSISFELYK